MGKSPYYIFLLLIFFGILYATKEYQKKFVPVELTDEITRPDILFSNSKQYVRKHSYERSLVQLTEAIEALKNIEVDVDSLSREKIDESIVDLEKVVLEFENKNFKIEDMNDAFAKALNALTIAELRITETLLKEEHTVDARVALKYGMYHLKNAIKYTEGKKKIYEVHIYDEIDSLLNSGSMDKEEMINKIEFMINELDQLFEDSNSDEEKTSSH